MLCTNIYELKYDLNLPVNAVSDVAVVVAEIGPRSADVPPGGRKGRLALLSSERVVRGTLAGLVVACNRGFVT